MKKILLIIIIIALGIGGYYLYNNTDILNNVKKIKQIPVLETEENKVEIDKYYIYGTSLNMEGKVTLTKGNFKDIALTLYNGKFKDIKINYEEDVNNITFNLSDEINNALYLDDIKKDKYYMFLKVTYEDDSKEKSKDIYKYYILDNKTTYDETTYYTMSNYNNKILINSKNDYKTMMLNITENKDKNIYDIVIDPGHGGMDGGAESRDKKYCERDFTLNIANNLKQSLEEKGFKVKLTHEEGDISPNELMEEYGKGGRAVISSEVYAKYLLSVHLNSNTSTKVKGFEIYTPKNINYDLAKSFVDNVTNLSGLSISSNKTNKISDGIYTKNFTETDIQNSLNGYKEKGINAYDITTDANYYYMIRETGGIVTGAYVDGRNESILANPYYNSNRGTEAYVLELGYITNDTDLDIIVNKQNEFIEAITNSFNDKFNLNNEED